MNVAVRKKRSREVAVGCLDLPVDVNEVSAPASYLFARWLLLLSFGSADRPCLTILILISLLSNAMLHCDVREGWGGGGVEMVHVLPWV